MRSDAAHALAGLGETPAVLLKGVEVPRPERARALDSGDARRPTTTPTGEPIYASEVTDDIQGNIVPGFNKDHQEFLFLRFGATDDARAWLAWLGPRLSSMTEVLDFRREFRAARLRLGVREPGLTATWTSMALSYAALTALLGEQEAARFGDESFRQGLAARSTYLGDPADPEQPGHRASWVVGGPDSEADVLVIVAADVPGDLEDEVDAVLAAASERGLVVLARQRGENLPGGLQGHEHFGFKDGVSQPGVRGALSATPGDEITPRHLASTDPHAGLLAKPGQPLVWPGQFLLGEPRQDPQDPALPAQPSAAFPTWAARGSYVVCRRLAQDVPGFWDAVAAAAGELGVTPVALAAGLVGRWPSGAPVSRSPGADDPVLAGDEFANNHFLFQDDTRPSALVPMQGYAGDDHPQAGSDIAGLVCPHVAHIRKVNPRDSGTDFGAGADTLMRLMLRRGIPYGPPIAGVAEPPPELVEADRGLMFVAYVASIEDQFEFVSRRWANSPLQPNPGGPDPVIGQQDRAGSRSRSVVVPAPDGTPATIHLHRDFVTPTGGGYFFAPPISAVSGVLSQRVGQE